MRRPERAHPSSHRRQVATCKEQDVMTKLNCSTSLSTRTLRHGLIAMLCFSLTFTPFLALPTQVQAAASQTRNFSPPPTVSCFRYVFVQAQDPVSKRCEPGHYARQFTTTAQYLSAVAFASGQSGRPQTNSHDELRCLPDRRRATGECNRTGRRVTVASA